MRCELMKFLPFAPYPHSFTVSNVKSYLFHQLSFNVKHFQPHLRRSNCGEFRVQANRQLPAPRLQQGHGPVLLGNNIMAQERSVSIRH
jgi:hypothetical protein